jgi:hypothetical protein
VIVVAPTFRSAFFLGYQIVKEIVVGLPFRYLGILDSQVLRAIVAADDRSLILVRGSTAFLGYLGLYLAACKYHVGATAKHGCLFLRSFYA